MDVVLAGLPLTGKTTLFDAMCAGAVDSAGDPARPERPNRASVAVPDDRLDRLADYYNARKVTPVHIDFLDVPGVNPGRSDMASRNTAITEHYRRADALVHVLRAFESQRTPHPLGRVDPVADRELVLGELLLSDLDITLRRIEKLEDLVTKPTPQQDEHRRELKLLQQVRDALEDERPVREAVESEADRARVRGYSYLTEKPMLSVLNVGEDRVDDPGAASAECGDLGSPLVSLAASIEDEIRQLDAEEREEFMEEMGVERLHMPDVLRGIYEALDRITFFTAGEKEVAARTLRLGETAVEAAEEIHTDLAKGFVRAEVIAYEDFAEQGGVKEARAVGKARTEGRDYVIADGDILLIHFTR